MKKVFLLFFFLVMAVLTLTFKESLATNYIQIASEFDRYQKYSSSYLWFIFGGIFVSYLFGFLVSKASKIIR